MFEKTKAIILVCILCLLLTSCSVLEDVMEEAGIDDDLRDKFDAAWNEVAKEGIDNLIDDAWREYGLGKSLNWPESGLGSLLPKLRSGSTEYCILSDNNSDIGCIKMSGVSEDDYYAYKEKLVELGFIPSIAMSSLSEIYTCDGMRVGLDFNDGTVYICFGNSVDEINNIYSACKSKE